jgi:signal transduction histidine kinase
MMPILCGMALGFSSKPGVWAFCLLYLLAGVCPVSAGDVHAPIAEVPSVTNISQLYELVQDGQPAICSFRLQGLVCEVNQTEGNMILRDDSGDLIVQMDLAEHPVRPGQMIRMEGTGRMRDRRLIVNRLPLVDNDGTHGMIERSGTIYLKAGRHPIRQIWFNGGGDYGLEVYYQGPDLPRQRIPGSALFRAQLNQESGTTNFVQGLNYRCYEGDVYWTELPDFSRLTPVKTGTVTNFDLTVETRVEHVGLEFNGYLEVPRDGFYVFSTKSDDGSQLFFSEFPHVTVEATGTAPVPAPRPVVICQVFSAAEAQKWSQVEGTVTFLSEQADGTELELASGAGRMRVKLVGNSTNAPLFLLNSQVRAKGFCQSTYTSEGQTVGGAMLVASWKDIEVMQVAGEYWTASTLTPIGTLLTNGLAATNEPIVRVRGTLVSVEADQSLQIADGTGQIRAEDVQLPSESVGTQVELLTKPEWQGTNLVLRGGFFREMARGSGTNTQTLPLLTSAEQIQYLPRAEAQRAYPLRIRGVITATIDWHQSFLVHDATRGIFVNGLNDGYGRQIGDFVEVEGVTEPGDFAPTVVATRVKWLGVGRMPNPIHPDRDQIINGSMDAQYVELPGVVTAVETNALTLLTLAGKYRVDLDLGSNDFARLKNALVRIKGTFISSWDDKTKRLKIGEFRFFAPAINVDEPPPADLFDAPVKTAAEMLFFDPKASALKRIKVRGQIVHRGVGEYYLMSGTNGLRVLSITTVPLQTGDLVEAVGFPELGGASPVLREATVRKTGHSPLPEPRLLTLAGTPDSDFNSTLVQIESQLVGMRSNATEQILELQSGPRTYLARLDASNGRVPVMPLGCGLRLTGVYNGQGGEQGEKQNMTSFELLLNSPSDVLIVRRPSWWTPQRTLMLGGSLALGLLLAVGWIRSLRRQVEIRTRELKGEIEERKRVEMEVEQIHKQLVDASRQAGQAEVASNVLHNVGNVLNSVNVSANVIANQVRRSKTAGGLTKIAALITEHEGDLPAFFAQEDRSRKIPQYLNGLVGQLGSEREQALNELQHLTKNIDHIKEIVATQQSYAKVLGVKEVQSISALVEDVLRMHSASFSRHQLRIVREFEPVPDVLLDKHRLLQILVNLISNAKNALEESTASEHLLTIGLRMKGEDMIQLSVTDNGVGITQENLAKIFTHGFTTRPEGHGFGLHSGILAAREMGGNLLVHSDGPGKGATFTLEIPRTQKDENPRQSRPVLSPGMA